AAALSVECIADRTAQSSQSSVLDRKNRPIIPPFTFLCRVSIRRSDTTHWQGRSPRVILDACKHKFAIHGLAVSVPCEVPQLNIPVHKALGGLSASVSPAG